MAVDWEELRKKQAEIDKDVAKIKEQQKQQSLQTVKSLAQSQSNVQAVKNVEAVQKKSSPQVNPVTQANREASLQAGFVSINPNIKTQEQKAAEVVENIKLRQALPSSTATIPSNQKIQIVSNPQPKAVTPQPEYSPLVSKVAEKVVESEQRSHEVTEFFKEKIFVKEPLYSDKPLVRHAQELAKGVFEGAYSATEVIPYAVGRTVLTGALLADKQGREYFWSAVKQTPKAIAQSYDIRTIQGQSNIILTGLAVGETAKRISVSKAKPEFIAEEAVTKRINTEGLTVDKVFVDVKASLNNKLIESKGAGSFVYAGEEKPVLTGAANIVDLTNKKVIQIDTIGRAEIKPGGADVLSVNEVKGVGKPKTIVDLTKSAELIKEPTQTFKTISISQEVTKNKILPSQVTTGVTGEFLPENILTGEFGGRKIIKGETGKTIAIEQTLASNKFGVSSEKFLKEFEGLRQQDLSQTFKERESFRPVTESGSQVTALKQVQVSKLPSQQNLVLNIAKEQVNLGIEKARTTQVAKSSTVSGIAVSGIKTNMQLMPKSNKLFSVGYEEVYIRTSPPITTQKPITDIISSKPSTSVVAKPIIESRHVSKAKPIAESKPLVQQKNIISSKPSETVKPIIGSRPIIASKPIIAVKPVTRAKPIIEAKPGFEPRGYHTPYPFQAFPELPVYPEPVSPFKSGGLYLPESSAKPKKVKGKVYNLELPSVESVIFNIRSKSYPKLQAITGLGTRPIKI